MSETVHVLVLGEGDKIDCLGGVYKHESRVQQAVEALEERALWSGDEQFVDYKSFDMVRAESY